MKKIVVLSCLFFALVADAQNYRSVAPLDTALYLIGGQQNLKTLLIDSVVVSGSDTLYYNRPSLIQSDSCIDPFMHSWLGSVMIVKPGGVNLYINWHNDTLTIQTQDTLDQDWVMYSSSGVIWTATVINIQSDSFLGITDTVKYIAITNGTISDTIELSQTKGWIKTFSFYQFPDSIIPMTLVGFDQYGVQNLTAHDVYNFDIGDEFHTDQITLTGTFTDETKIIERVIGKQIFGDTTEYTFEVCKWDSSLTYLVNDSGTIPISSVTTTHDTIDQTNFSLENLYDNFDNDATFIDSFSFCSYHYNGTICGPSAGYNYQIINSKYNQRGLKVVSPELLCGDSICYSLITITLGLSPPPIPFYAIDGVGFYYNTYNWAEANAQLTDSLVYYKKGMETWGTPYDCSVLLSVPSPPVQDNIVLYPNPANDEIWLSGAVLPGATLSIFDLTGKLLYNASPGNSPINISSLSQGMYLVRIFDNQRQAVYNKVFVKQ